MVIREKHCARADYIAAYRINVDERLTGVLAAMRNREASDLDGPGDRR
ncbi:hypothetical protein [Mycobacterium attenuatum]|nr:hypothetical protein [Mycobacterium attenuatum]